ncbi:hypothetical protein LA080_003462 [Diaporthe eres]|nr:hypothetical protein LA080_003462 [Diaporthe eres]
MAFHPHSRPHEPIHGVVLPVTASPNRVAERPRTRKRGCTGSLAWFLGSSAPRVDRGRDTGAWGPRRYNGASHYCEYLVGNPCARCIVGKYNHGTSPGTNAWAQLTEHCCLHCRGENIWAEAEKVGETGNWTIIIKHCISYQRGNCSSVAEATTATGRSAELSPSSPASSKAAQRTSKAEEASNNPSESLPGAAEPASTPTTSEGTLPPPEPPSPTSTAAPLLDSPDGDFAAMNHDLPSSTEAHISGVISRPIGSAVAVAGSPTHSYESAMPRV